MILVQGILPLTCFWNTRSASSNWQESWSWNPRHLWKTVTPQYSRIPAVLSVFRHVRNIDFVAFSVIFYSNLNKLINSFVLIITSLASIPFSCHIIDDEQLWVLIVACNRAYIFIASLVRKLASTACQFVQKVEACFRFMMHHDRYYHTENALFAIPFLSLIKTVCCTFCSRYNHCLTSCTFASRQPDFFVNTHLLFISTVQSFNERHHYGKRKH